MKKIKKKLMLKNSKCYHSIMTNTQGEPDNGRKRIDFELLREQNYGEKFIYIS